MSRHLLSRRRFLGGLSAAASLMIVPRRVLGGRGFQAPSDTLNVAGIGVGGRGRADVRGCDSENITALCDVDFGHAARTFNLYPKARTYADYRRMLDAEPDLDAVIIATPDPHPRGHRDGGDAAGQARVLREAPHPHRRRGARPGDHGPRAGRGHPDGEPGPRQRRHPAHPRVDRGRRRRHRARGAVLDQPAHLAAGHRAAHRGPSRPAGSRLGPVPGAGPRTAVPPRVSPVPMARMVGLWHRRPRRHRLSLDGRGVLGPSARPADPNRGRDDAAVRRDGAGGVAHHLRLPGPRRPAAGALRVARRRPRPAPAAAARPLARCCRAAAAASSSSARTASSRRTCTPPSPGSSRRRCTRT